MPRKKDDTPKGGWDTPAVNGKPDPRPAQRYAAGVDKNGKWIWKPIDAAYLKWCEEQKAKANGTGLKVRQRTRTLTK